MAKGCMMVTKYFLFLFNLIFFLFGAIIMGFGLWLLLDNQSFLAVLQDSSMALKVASYVLIGVGGFSMLMGFLGCLGAIYEVRCLLGLYFACLLLILIAQVTAGALVYFQKDTINDEMSKIVRQVLDNYGKNTTTEQAWDFIQRKMECCGWTGRMDWDRNGVIVNSSQLLFPCSCQNVSLATGGNVSDAGFCEAAAADDWPVYDVGCSSSVEGWLLTNLGVILGICLAVAVIELLGMILSICLCKSVTTQREDYTKVPKY